MLLVGTYVAPSRLEGLGVFASEPIAAGAVIWRLDPDLDQLIPLSRYRAAPPLVRAHLDRYAYPSLDRPDHLVYEFGDARFMNHSPAPNTSFAPDDHGVALRDIAAGEEITCDYGEFHEGFTLLPSRAPKRA